MSAMMKSNPLLKCFLLFLQYFGCHTSRVYSVFASLTLALSATHGLGKAFFLCTTPTCSPFVPLSIISVITPSHLFPLLYKSHHPQVCKNTLNLPSRHSVPSPAILVYRKKKTCLGRWQSVRQHRRSSAAYTWPLPFSLHLSSSTIKG